jgi:hypothetical protein
MKKCSKQLTNLFSPSFAIFYFWQNFLSDPESDNIFSNKFETLWLKQLLFKYFLIHIFLSLDEMMPSAQVWG